MCVCLLYQRKAIAFFLHLGSLLAIVSMWRTVGNAGVFRDSIYQNVITFTDDMLQVV